MNVVVSFIFNILHLPYKGIIFIVDKLSYCNPYPTITLYHETPCFTSNESIPIIWLDNTMPTMNYVDSCPLV